MSDEEIYTRLGKLEQGWAAMKERVDNVKEDITEIKNDVKCQNRTLERLTVAMEKPKLISNAGVWVVCTILAAIVSVAIGVISRMGG